MKIVLTFIILIQTIGCGNHADRPFSPPAPPPPLTYSAPKESEIKEFVFRDDGFKADFSVEPKVVTKEVPGAIVKTYQVRRADSNTEITVTRFSSDVKMPRPDEVYERFKSGFQLRHKAELIDEKEIEYGTQKGMEFTFQMPLEYMKLRLLYSGQIGYQLNISCINWRGQSEIKKEEFERETQRFFNSFETIK